MLLQPRTRHLALAPRNVFVSGPVSAGCEATDYVTASLSFGQWTGAQDDSPRALFLGPLNLADQKRKPFLAFYCANSISCSQPNTPLRRHLPQNVGYNHLPTGTSFDTYDSLVFNTLTLNAHFLGNARNRYAFWPRNDLDEPLSTGFSTGSVDKLPRTPIETAPPRPNCAMT